MAHRTRNSPLKAATDAVETAEGHDVVLLLTPEQLLRKRDRCFRLPAGCPEGPWPSEAVELAAINRWASDHTKVGGSWGVTWLKGVDKGNTARGRQHASGCDQQKRQHCGWRMTLEETTKAWMIYSFTEHKGGDGKLPPTEHGHSHDLAITLRQRLVRITQRVIPEELHEIAKLMRKSGSSIKDVENLRGGLRPSAHAVVAQVLSCVRNRLNGKNPLNVHAGSAMW